MHTTKVQSVPPPPAPSPQRQDQSVIEAGQNERRRQMTLYGRRSTMLTGKGVGESAFSGPSLLGAGQ